jgi:hypothetical protein
VAALGASSYTYACATPRQTMADWIESTARALAFIGGVPQLIVPDNPKAMIADANRYEPRSNDTVLDTPAVSISGTDDSFLLALVTASKQCAELHIEKSPPTWRFFYAGRS